MLMCPHPLYELPPLTHPLWVVLGHLIILFPASSGVSERVAQYLRPYSWLFCPHVPPLHPCSPTFHLIFFVPPPSTFPSGLNLHRSTLNSVVNSLPEAKQKLKQTPVEKIKIIKKRKKETKKKKKSKKKPLSCRYVFTSLWDGPCVRLCESSCVRPSVNPSVYPSVCFSAFHIHGDLTAIVSTHL